MVEFIRQHNHLRLLLLPLLLPLLLYLLLPLLLLPLLPLLLLSLLLSLLLLLGISNWSCWCSCCAACAGEHCHHCYVCCIACWEHQRVLCALECCELQLQLPVLTGEASNQRRRARAATNLTSGSANGRLVS
jgi:hypothetical protein